MISNAIELNEALSVYFEAKERLHRRCPHFRMIAAGPLRGFHRHPGWPEADAFYAVDCEPAEVVDAIRRYGPDPDHRITVLSYSADQSLDMYPSLGYHRLPAAQTFLSLRLTDVGAAPVYPVQTVATQEQVNFINTPEVYMDAAHFRDGDLRYYYIEQDGAAVCRGRTVTTSQSAIYVAGLDTLAAYRRCGLALSLMSQMQRDALADGCTLSVLCSTAMGLGLYQRLGYRVLATMQPFAPASQRR